MNTETLKYFLEIANGATFLDVSENNHISQSNLSKSISRLEDELNVDLFDRSGRKIKLTPAGISFKNDLEKIRPQVESMIHRVKSYANGTQINCTIYPDLNILHMRYHISCFLKNHPDIYIHLNFFQTQETMISNIENMTQDLIIAHQSLM